MTTKLTVRRRLRVALVHVAAGLGVVVAGAPPAVFPSAAIAQGAEVTLEALSFTAGPISYRVPRALVRGTSLSRAELEALLSGSSPMPLQARIAALSAREIVIPEIVSELTASPGNQTTTYKDVVFKDVAGGRIGAIVAGSGVFAGAAGSNTPAGSFGRFSIENTDLGLAVALFTDTAATEPGPMKRLYGTFALDDLSLRDKDGVTTRIARFAGRDFSARTLRGGWVGLIEAMGRNPDLAAAPPEERKRVFTAMAEMLGAFEIGLIEMTGIAFAGGKADAGQGRIGRIAFAGGSGDRAGETTLENLDVTMPDGSFKLGSASFGGFALKPYFEALGTLASAKPEEMSAAEMRKLIPMLGTLRMSALDMDVPGEPDATGAPARVRFSLGAVEIAAEKPVEGIPSEARVAFRNIAFTVPPASENDAAKQLIGLGYDKVDMSFAADLGWNAAGQEIAVRDLSLSGAGMGSIAIRAVLGNIGKDVFDPDTAISTVALLGATARSMEIAVDNRGLADRILGRDSRASGRPIEELRREYGSFAAIGIPAVLGNSASAKSIGQAVARFIARPGRLLIQARAKAPGGLGVADVAAGPDPTALLQQLDVTATAE